MLTISVKNFGPIAEGSVDLKPLTIFVGPSNTGKSYMATAVHAVMRAVPKIGNQFVRLPRDQSWELPDDVLNALWNWVQHEQQNSRAKWELKVDLLPDIVRSWLDSETSKRLNAFQWEVIEEIRLKLGEAPSFLRSGAGKETFRVAIHQDIPRLDLESRLAGESISPPTLDISQFHLPEQMYSVTPYFLLQAKDERARTEMAALWCNSISASLFATMPVRSYYLPAGRSAITRSHKVFSATILRQHSSFRMREIPFSLMPGIDAEFLANLIVIDRRMATDGDDETLKVAVGFIENEVLHGIVDIDESAGLPFPDIVYLPVTGQESLGKFTLDQTSSMVSELAPLILFLKYLVRPGDLLILEEPESHLHPAAQRQLARGIVRLVNAGVKVLITTHSETFVAQVNHLLRISYASKRWLRENGFTPEDCLKHEDVSAYMFRMDEELGGNRVDELEIQRDIGIDDPLFNDVINALYEESLLVQRIRIK